MSILMFISVSDRLFDVCMYNFYYIRKRKLGLVRESTFFLINFSITVTVKVHSRDLDRALASSGSAAFPIPL